MTAAGRAALVRGLRALADTLEVVPPDDAAEIVQARLALIAAEVKTANEAAGERPTMALAPDQN